MRILVVVWKFPFERNVRNVKSYATSKSLATLFKVTQLGRCIRSYQFKFLFIGRRTPHCKADTCGHSLCTFNVWLNEILIDLRHVELTVGSCVEFPKLVVAFQTCFVNMFLVNRSLRQKVYVNGMTYPQNLVKSFKKKSPKILQRRFKASYKQLRFGSLAFLQFQVFKTFITLVSRSFLSRLMSLRGFQDSNQVAASVNSGIYRLSRGITRRKSSDVHSLQCLSPCRRKHL